MTSEDTLNAKAFNQITTCLWDARHKWRQIGFALCIDYTTLEVISLNYHRSIDDCMTTMLGKWLRNGRPCWKVLAEALRSPLVGVTVEEGKLNSNYLCSPQYTLSD